MAGGGLLLTDKNPLVVASALHRISTDLDLVQRLRDAGRQRANAFDRKIIQERFSRHISALLESS